MRNILIIDDEEEFCFFIKEALEITGKYAVIIRTNGSDGFDAAVKFRPDLILLDIMMPGADGFEVLKALKEDNRTIAIPVIMVTAKADDISRTQALKWYNEDYLIKPIKVSELRERLEKVLSRIS